MTCEPKEKIGALGSSYFLGFAISSGITPSLADKHGRKIPYLASLMVQTLAYFFIIVSKDINAVIGYYFVVGLAAGGRVGVGLNYLAEFIPQKHQGSLCSIVNCGDACVMIFQSVYYYFCKNWLYLHLFNLTSACLIILLVMVLPESPKYYYANKNYFKARETLMKIAKYNGKTFATYKYLEAVQFDTEVSSSENDNHTLSQSGNT